MSSCYKCGSSFSGYGSVCPTCKQTEVLKEQSEKALRLQQDTATRLREDAWRQNELMEEQLEVSRQHAAAQLEISRLQAKAQLASEEFKAQELAKQTEQAEMQTRLLLEQSISTDDAYQQGYEFVTLLLFDPNDPESEVLHHHALYFGLKESGEVFAESIEPDFITPKLKKAYFDGVKERFRKDFSRKISLDYLKQKAYEAGLGECTIQQVQESGGAFKLAYVESGVGIEFWTHRCEPNVSYAVDEASGKVGAQVGNPKVFDNPELNDAFGKGLLEYVESENSPAKCQDRLEKIRAHAQLVAQMQAEHLRKEDEYHAALARDRKKEAIAFTIVSGLCVLGALVSFGLIYTGHWFYFIISLVISYHLLKGLFTGDFTAAIQGFLGVEKPIKPEVKPVPALALDDDPLYEEAARLVNAGLPPLPSQLQRKLRIGYNRANRLLGAMENRGVIASRKDRNADTGLQQKANDAIIQDFLEAVRKGEVK